MPPAPSSKLQGEYATSGLGLQLVAVGDDEYEFALYAGGLPEPAGIARPLNALMATARPSTS